VVEAESVHREQVASWGKRAGNDDPQTLYALRELGITLEYGGKWAEAETVHREALASWRKTVGNDDPQTLYTLDRLGWTLQGEGKWLKRNRLPRSVDITAQNGPLSTTLKSCRIASSCALCSATAQIS